MTGRDVADSQRVGSHRSGGLGPDGSGPNETSSPAATAARNPRRRSLICPTHPLIASYAVDKKLRTEDLFLERVDVITGAVLTGVIGFFVVVACAATLHRDGRSIQDAADAAVALEPLAGVAASKLFAVGLIGAAFLGCLRAAALDGLLGMRICRRRGS